MWLALLAGLACLDTGPGSDPAPAEAQLPSLAAPAPPAPLDLGAAGPPVVRLRDALDDATLSLPPRVLPEAERSEGRFMLRGPWTQSGTTTAWKHASPVRLPHAFYRSDPPGVRLERDGERLPYAPATSDRPVRLGGWEIEDGIVYLTAPRDPAAESSPLVLVDEGTARKEARMEPAGEGLQPAAYVAWRTTLGDLTRDVLLLPPPASASFPLAPAGTARTLRFGYALAEAPRPGLDGAARFVVEVDGAPVWTAEARSGEPFVEARVDVPPAATRVTLRTEAVGGGPAWAVFAEPELVPGASEAGPRRVVVIGLDTVRPDHLSTAGYRRPTTPGLQAIAAQSLRFDRAWAPAPRTRPSFRTALTGRWPLAAIEAPTLAEQLRAQGFSTAGFVANVHFVPRLGLSDGFGWWTYHDSDDAGPQVDRALAWLGEHRDEDTLVFLHLMDAHVFYLAPEPWTDRFTEGLDRGDLPDRYNRWVVQDWMAEGAISDGEKAWMEARYDGELAYMDGEIHRLVAALDALPGRTLVVLLSDHGEEFWEHGGYEHNHTLYDEVVRSVLWIRPPGGRAGGGVVDAPVSLADVVPTVLDAVGVAEADRPPLDGRSLAAAFDDPRRLADDRALPLGHLMFAPERWGVVVDGHKYLLETGSGREELYDLVRDPGEARNLVETVDAAPWRAALATATGFPVESGWRVTLQGTRAPWSLTFPQPVLGAHVVDPEALRNVRANLEWGEVPPRLPADVGAVEVSADRLTVTFTPGSDPRGVLAIRGPGPTTTARAGATGPTVRPGAVHRLGAAPAQVTAGPILTPTDTEARRLAEIQDPDAIAALRALGYLEE